MHTNGQGFAPVGVGASCDLAAQGTTTLAATFPIGAVPQPGQYFSTGDRLYLVNSVVLISSTKYQLGFVPRLRSAVTQGQFISFTNLSCVMRLTDEVIQKIAMGPRSSGHIDLDFVEAII